MADSNQLANEAAAAQAAAEAMLPEVEATQERLAQATTDMEASEAAYNLALESEAEGTAADVEGLESRRNLARRTWQGLGSLAGRLTTTMMGHRDEAEARQKAALLARRAERAALAMERIPQLTEGIVEAVLTQGELGHALELERGILMQQGPWNRAASGILSASNRRLKEPIRLPKPENRGERIARELELTPNTNLKGACVMNKRWERAGAGTELVFTHPHGHEVAITVPAADANRIRKDYEAKGFVFVRTQGHCDPVSNSGAHLRGDKEVDIETGAIRVLTSRESVEVKG